MQARIKRSIPTTLGALLLAAVIFTAYTAQQAFATHQPADKTAAAGSTVEVVGPQKKVEILREQMRVSSPSDLILQLTAECAIVTDTETGDDSEGGPEEQFSEDEAVGNVRVWIEIDGKPVPVSTGGDDGSVVLCNRDQRQEANESETQEDAECQLAATPVGEEAGDANACDDGLDSLEIYQATRQANGFNWFAINGGTYFDDLTNGQNILDIVVYADLDLSCASGRDDCAEAMIGNRTLVVEPVHASNDETTSPGGRN